MVFLRAESIRGGRLIRWVCVETLFCGWFYAKSRNNNMIWRCRVVGGRVAVCGEIVFGRKKVVWGILTVICLSVLLQGQSCAAVRPVYMEDSPVAVELLVKAKKEIANDNWVQACRILRQIIDEHSHKLMPMGEDVYRDAIDVVKEVLCKNQSLLEVYQRLYDPVAVRELGKARLKGWDAKDSEELIAKYELMAKGLEASFGLVSIYLERADWQCANSVLDDIELHPRLDNSRSKYKEIAAITKDSKGESESCETRQSDVEGSQNNDLANVLLNRTESKDHMLGEVVVDGSDASRIRTTGRRQVQAINHMTRYAAQSVIGLPLGDNALKPLADKVDVKMNDVESGLALVNIAKKHGQPVALIQVIDYSLKALQRLLRGGHIDLYQQQQQIVFNDLFSLLENENYLKNKYKQEVFNRLASIVKGPEQETKYHFAAARFAESERNYAKAVEHYQSLLIDQELALMPFTKHNMMRLAGIESRLRLESLIEDVGGHIYNTYEEIARQNLRALSVNANVDAQDLELIAKCYPL